MTNTAKHKVKHLIQSQFASMSDLAAEIRALNEQGQAEHAMRLAKILDRLSKDSLEIVDTISDRAA